MTVEQILTDMNPEDREQLEKKIREQLEKQIKLNNKQKRKWLNKQDYSPSKYPKPVKAKLTTISKGGGLKTIDVEEISSEIIKLPDGKEIYTGVAPQPHKIKGRTSWKNERIHFAEFGMPFTFTPGSNTIFSDEKKRQILLERGVATSIKFDDREVVVLLDWKKDVPTPYWREDIIALERDKIEKLNNQSTQNIDNKPIPPIKQDFKTISDLKQWIIHNTGNLEYLEHTQLPVKTEYDVSAIDMMRAESFQLIESKAIEKAILAMEKVGSESSVMWYFLGAIGSIMLMLFMFLYFANDGVFNQGAPPVVNPASILRLFL